MEPGRKHMATYTTNLNLEKPSYDDPPDIEVVNSNMDVIDGAFGEMSQDVSDALHLSGGTMINDGMTFVHLDTTLTSDYTCPVDGWYSFTISSSDGRVAGLNVSGNIILGVASGMVAGSVPLKAGTVVGVRGGLSNTTYTLNSYLAI